MNPSGTGNMMLGSLFQVAKVMRTVNQEYGKPHRLSQHFFLHHHIALEVELAFVPESTVGQMMFTRGRAHSKLFGNSFVVRSAFISAGFRGFSFRIRHNNKWFTFSNFLTFPSGDQWLPLYSQLVPPGRNIPGGQHHYRLPDPGTADEGASSAD